MFHISHPTLFRLLLVSTFFFPACAASNRYGLIGSGLSRNTVGVLEAEAVDSSSTLVNLELSHLPPPTRLAAGYGLYMAWVLPPHRNAVRGPILAYRENRRSAQVMFTTVHRVFKVQVTLEPLPNPNQPSSHVLVEQNVNLN